MLTRLYVDNYKCLVNFDLKPDQMHLVVGLNGTGKSTVLHVLQQLQHAIVDNASPYGLFPPDTLTRWQTLSNQTFEIDVARESETYRYKLVIEHDADRRQNRVLQEELLLDGRKLFYFNEGHVELYRDNFTAGPEFRWDWLRFGLAGVADRDENTKLIWFKKWFQRLLCVQINPWSIERQSDAEVHVPDFQMRRFPSWYRHLVQEEPGRVHELYAKLKDVVGGFDSLPLKEYGEGNRMLCLRINVRGQKRGIDYPFDELSEGQRCLVVLYTILCLASESDKTVVIDEPENFVALQEIQPWLGELTDACTDRNMQAILTSHHPEVINRFAPTQATILTRDGGPTRAEPFGRFVADDEPMTAAELVATGELRAKAVAG